jgi:hypothetical protein
MIHPFRNRLRHRTRGAIVYSGIPTDDRPARSWKIGNQVIDCNRIQGKRDIADRHRIASAHNNWLNLIVFMPIGAAGRIPADG